MRATRHSTILVVALAAFLSAARADDQDKTKKSDGKDKLISVGYQVVVLTQVESAQKSVHFNLQVPYGRGLRTVPMDYQMADDVKVRMANPPAEFDLKGNPKRYTSKELKELKGPGNLWGYKAETDNLKTGQTVRIYLKKRKDAPKASGKDKEFQADNKPIVTEIHILVEPKK